MDLVPVQICRTTEGWSPVQVPSSSTKGLNYTVLVNPYVSKREFVCDCRGFEFRGHCRHQELALVHVCWWPIVPRQPQLDQTDEQRKNKVCPNCGGATMYELRDIDDA
jgi:hypothetical protein